MADFNDFATEKTAQMEMDYYTQRFVLWPKQFKSLSVSISLDWKKVRFSPSNTAAVEEKPGIYAFAVQHADPALPPNGYITYIGQTGGKAAHRTLRDRFGDYLREKERPKRPHVHHMLNKWDDYLVFYFAAVDTSQTDLELLEDQLNDALIPPYSKGDYSADIRKRKGIWEVS
jgi:hypothetical protein